MLFLIFQFLSDDGYWDTATTLAREANIDVNKHRVCDNIDLLTILMEYEAYYYVRFNKYPKLTRKITDGMSLKLLNFLDFQSSYD